MPTLLESIAAPQDLKNLSTREMGQLAKEIRQLIIDTAEDVDSPGFDEKTGFGRINAFEAVSAAASSEIGRAHV